MSKSRKSKKPAFVDSLYVSDSGAHVKIRTHLGGRSNTYAIFVDGTLEYQLSEKARVRAYIMRNDCHQVESFPKAKTFSQ
jgi:hypothetical protein